MRFAAMYLGCSALLGCIWLALSYPDRPSSPVGWACLFVLALPVQLIVELVAQRSWDNPLTQRVESLTRHKPLSLLRIGYGVIMLLLISGLLVAAGYAWLLLQAKLA